MAKKKKRGGPGLSGTSNINNAPHTKSNVSDSLKGKNLKLESFRDASSEQQKSGIDDIADSVYMRYKKVLRGSRML